MDNVEKRFCYNPFTKQYFSGYNSHTEQIYNAKESKNFDFFIRGIIFDDCLYLRVYFPLKNFPDNVELLNKKSLKFLRYYYREVRQVLKEKENLTPKDTFYNVTNDILQGLNLANI